MQEGLRLSLSRGLRHSCSLGDTHLAIVLELHPASITESLWGKGRTIRLEDHSREDCKKAESLGQSIQVPSFQTTSHFLSHAHDHLFHVYIPIRLFFLEIFRKKILYHRSASFIIFFPNACYSMLKICFIFYIFNSFIHITLFFWPCGMWDFSSSIRDQTHAPCRRSVES